MLQVSPPRLLRGSTGPAVPDSNAFLPTNTALPQTILSSRRRQAHQPASAVRGTDLHRELQTHAAVDWIAPDGQHGVVTSHIVFGDETWGTIDNSILSSDDEDGMSLQSQRQHSQFLQHSSVGIVMVCTSASTDRRDISVLSPTLSFPCFCLCVRLCVCTLMYAFYVSLFLPVHYS